MAPDAREPRLLRVLTDARGRDFAALDDALGEAGGALVRRARVVVRGLSPVGVETARLLLASDVGEIVLLDEPRDATVTPADIGATSVLGEEHLGKPRARAVVEALNAPRFRPNHRESPVVRAAGRTDDALWMGEKECDEKEEDDDATRYASRLPDALVSAWHVDTPQLAAHAPGETSGEDRIASAVLGNGGTHVLAAAPGLFAFARATRAPRRRRETSASASAAETSVSSDSSDSEEDASRVAREVSVRGVTEMAERRFRDARLARAPVSLVESAVPVDAVDAVDAAAAAAARLGEAKRARTKHAPKRNEKKEYFFVTVCDANAHGLREGDGVAFLDARLPPKEEEPRRRRLKGVVASVASPYAFTVAIDRHIQDRSVRGGSIDVGSARLAGTYVRQRRRRDAAFFFTPPPPRATLANGGLSKRKRDESAFDDESVKQTVAPTDVRGVSSFFFSEGRERAAGLHETAMPAVAAARVATAFLELGDVPRKHEEGSARDGDVRASHDVSHKPGNDYDDDDDADVAFAIAALRRGARVAFPPCVGIAAAVAAHETLKALARVQVPLAEGTSAAGGWFAHDFLELDPGVSGHVSSSSRRRKNAVSSRDAASESHRAPAATLADLIGAELVREAATRDVAVVGTSDRGRAFAETLAQVSSSSVNTFRAYPSLASVPSTVADAELDVLIVAGLEGFEARRAADAFAMRRRLSLIDAAVENHAYSAYVAAVDRTAPWSVSGARDPGEPSFPSCVVGNFPHAFPHCAQWARERFSRHFVELPTRVAEWREAWAAFRERDETADRETFFRETERARRAMRAPEAIDALEHALEAARDVESSRAEDGDGVRSGARPENRERPASTRASFERACVAWSLDLFERLFVSSPREARRANPPDASFWSGTKRAPTELAFDVTDPHHATFVVAASVLRAATLRGGEGRAAERGAEGEDPDAARARFLRTLLETARARESPDAAPRDALIDASIDANGDAKEDDPRASRASRLADATLDAFERESNDDANGDGFVGFAVRNPRDPNAEPAFVAAAAACRARVFGVPVPRERELAAAATGARPGTPAPAAFAAALAAAETYKLAKSTPAKKKTRFFSGALDGDVSVGFNLVARAEPDDEHPDNPPSFRKDLFFRCSYGSLGGHAHVSASPAALATKTTRTSPTTPDVTFTAWDAWTFDARDGVSLAGFLDRFRERVGLEPSAVARGKALLFADFMNLAKPETAARLNTPLVKLFEDALVDGETTPARVGVSVTACDERDEDVDVPEVWVRIR